MKLSKKFKLPLQLDLSILQFLQYGDRELIAITDRKNGHKTHANYVGEVLKGNHRNDRILQLAFALALKRMGNFPKQAFKPQAHAA